MRFSPKSLMPVLVAASALSLALPVAATAAPKAPSQPLASESTLHRYAADTWASFVAMTYPRTGLPADSLRIDGTRSIQTSTTNIGAYMWSAVVAERLGIVSHGTLVSRLSRTISTLETMRRDTPSGQYFNWYDARNGNVITVWPPTGEPVTPILSSVDNGWLATGLRVVRGAVPELAARANAIYQSMNFGFYYEPSVNRILFHAVPSTGERICCYDTAVSEARIASYVGISNGQLPQKEYFGTWRTFPDTCDWSWQETKPYGQTRQYFGQDVFDGAYRYAGMRITPGWGGSAFEDLMPSLFVPEERWAPGSWRLNHPLTVRAQIYHGLVEAQYGYWGFSPANTPEGGYSVYGVDAIGMNPEGYPSNEDNTLVDHGFPGCREGKPNPPPSAYTNGVVTPHAAALGLRWAPEAVVRNLEKLRQDFNIYSKWGFRDSVNVDTGVVSEYYLSLDQGIIMAAIGNAVADDVLRQAFVGPDVQQRLRPVLGVEQFNDSPLNCTIFGTNGDDVLRGTSGNDIICGFLGNDVIYGNGGDDVIYGDGGDDTIHAGAGTDTVYAGDGNDKVYGDDGDDVLNGEGGADLVDGGSGTDQLEGGYGADQCDAASAGDSLTDCE